MAQTMANNNALCESCGHPKSSHRNGLGSCNTMIFTYHGHLCSCSRFSVRPAFCPCGARLRPGSFPGSLCQPCLERKAAAEDAEYN